MADYNEPFKGIRGGGRSGGNGGGNGRFGGALDGSGPGPLGAYVPPQDLQAEQSTLGAMLIERAAVEKAAEILDKEDFYRDAHQTLFEVITALAERDEPVDFITVGAELKNRDKLEAIGGETYLMALLDTVPTAANIEYYAKIVGDKAILRRLIEASFQIVGLARGEVENVSEVLDEAEKLVFGVAQQQTGEYFAHLRNLLLQVYDKAEELGELKQRISGLSTGHSRLRHDYVGPPEHGPDYRRCQAFDGQNVTLFVHRRACCLERKQAGRDLLA